jgi:hypothetical protein
MAQRLKGVSDFFLAPRRVDDVERAVPIILARGKLS